MTRSLATATEESYSVPDQAPAVAPDAPAPGPPSTPPSATPTVEPYWAKPSIGIFSLTLFMVALGVSWFAKTDTAFNLMIGAVISNATTVVGYYFGSSSGSAQKTALLASSKSV